MRKSIHGLRMPGTMEDKIHQLDKLRPLMAQKATHLLAPGRRPDRHRPARPARPGHSLWRGCRRKPLICAGRDVEERVREISRSNTRDPEVDMIFEVVICDDGDHAIMMSFTEHEDWVSDMRSLPGATVSSHWSGTDSSDGFSAEDWAHRRRTYQRILSRDPHGRPAGCRASLV